MTSLAIPFLLLIALVSPVLTLTRLLQQKEWRMDRLREHLNKEGWWLQLFGFARPALALIWLGIFAVGALLGSSASFANALCILFLILLCAVGCMQIGTGQQRTPVWTSKAIIITGLTLLFGLLGAILIITLLTNFASVGIGILAALPPLWVFLAWSIFLPIDVSMKNRILRKAEILRKSHPNLIVIGITGSVGKTTMKGLLEHLLKDKGAIATPERVNSEIGVARWITTLLKDEPAESNRIIVVEMGAYRIGEIALLCRIARPTIGIITTIGTQHLSLFGGKEQIVQAKGELFESLPETGIAFGNSDNPAFGQLKARAKCRTVGIGTGHHTDVQVFDIEETGNGVRFKIFDTVFTSSLAGTHSVTGIAMAIAVAKHLGVTTAESVKKLPSFQRMHSTFEVKTMEGVSVLDDSYNSSPESVSAAIRWAATRPESKKTLLLEGVIELGDQEEALHRELADEAAKVFQTVFVAHSRLLPYFQDALGSQVHEASKAGPAEVGSLLVICGRVSPAILKRFLPSS